MFYRCVAVQEEQRGETKCTAFILIVHPKTHGQKHHESKAEKEKYRKTATAVYNCRVDDPLFESLAGEIHQFSFPHKKKIFPESLSTIHQTPFVKDPSAEDETSAYKLPSALTTWVENPAPKSTVE